ncbi:hypothetical protein Y1Q_0008802 [Alligator mississippiensis]|uniref:ribonuclease H n=1 Tax=Alligator mississippiensis TaxID=8496 RepID=A0A151NA73_ALLMI|nr:hypothetical protein Y1Q_0008802 [Alligator mississippiensis]
MEARLVVDYRQANRRCKPLQMPATQTVSDILDGMTEIQRGGKWFATTLDLKDMFYSIPIHDPYGILNMRVGGQMFSWKVCPPGYRNAPALAVTAMNGTIDSFVRPRPKTADVHIWTYVDDIVIMGHDHAAVRATTADLKDHLSNQGWTVNLAKSMSDPSSDIKFLGTRFTGQWRSGTAHNATPELSSLWPTMQADFQGLLGQLNWFRNFMTPPHLKVIQRLQHQIRKKTRHRVPWSEHDQASLEKVMTEVKKMSLIAPPAGSLLTIHVGYTTEHIWFTVNDTKTGELAYTGHRTLKSHQHR